MPKPKAFLVIAMSLAFGAAACSSDAGTSGTTVAGGSTPLEQPIVTTGQILATLPSATVLAPIVPATVDTTPATTPPASNTSSATNDWEVVGGIFTTKAAAQSQIDKLTTANFTGFSIKVVGAKFAAVLPGLSNSAATDLAAKINSAGAATATLFHLTDSSTTTGSATTKDWEVVGGIFTTKAAAQSQIDKLTTASFTGFSIKVVGAKFAAVLPGLTNSAATALAAKINKAGTATATIFHLTTSSTTSTTPTTTTVADASATNFEVVDGIFTTKAAAQDQIDKLTTAKFTGFTIKPITGKFAVVRAGMTQADANALVTKINATALGPARVKAL